MEHDQPVTQDDNEENTLTCILKEENNMDLKKIYVQISNENGNESILKLDKISTKVFAAGSGSVVDANTLQEHCKNLKEALLKMKRILDTDAKNLKDELPSGYVLVSVKKSKLRTYNVDDETEISVKEQTYLYDKRSKKSQTAISAKNEAINGKLNDGKPEDVAATCFEKYTSIKKVLLKYGEKVIKE